MERYTKHLDGGGISGSDKSITKTMLRWLVAYEDTNLEPEEVIRVERERDYYHKQAVEIANLLDHKDNDFRKLNHECNYWKNEAKKAMAQLGEIKIAEEQGLYIKLPCKKGDTVWFIMAEHYDRSVAEEEGKICSCTIESITIEEPYWSFNHGEHKFKLSDFRKTIFITRETAEETLNKTINANSEKTPVQIIEEYIKKCNYTYKVEDILKEYQEKYLKGSYVSHTMNDCIVNLEPSIILALK